MAEGRDRGEGKQERSEQGDDVGEGQRKKHLSFDPLQGDDRDEGQGDDEFAEDGGLADLQDPLQDRFQLMLRPGLRKAALDVLDLDDRRVDDHADGDGQSAERHEIGRKPGDTHHDEGEEDRKGQGQQDDEGAAEAAQEKIEDEDHEHRSDEQGLGHGVDGPADDIRALVIGFNPEAHGQDARSVDFIDPLLDRPDDVAAVGAAEHHDDAADDFVVPVLHGAALADGVPGPNLRHVPDEDGCPLPGFQRDRADVFDRLQKPDSPDEELPLVTLQDVAAGVEVVPAQRLGDAVERQVVGGQKVGIHDDVKLSDIAPEGVDFVDPGDRLEERREGPVLNRPDLRQVFRLIHALGPAPRERVLIDFPHGRGNRAHGDLGSLGDALPGFDEPLEDELAGEVDIDAVLEDDGDDGEAGLGNRTNLIQAREPAHGRFDREGDEPLDFRRRHAGSRGQDFDLDVGDVGEGVDGDPKDRPDPQHDEEEDSDKDEDAPAERSFDQAVNHAHVRPPGRPCGFPIRGGSRRRRRPLPPPRDLR